MALPVAVKKCTTPPVSEKKDAEPVWSRRQQAVSDTREFLERRRLEDEALEAGLGDKKRKKKKKPGCRPSARYVPGNELMPKAFKKG